MPTDAVKALPVPDLAGVRILRLAFGTASCLWVSQAVAWDLAYIAPIVTIVVLALPLPAPKLKAGVGLIAALSVSLLAGLALLPRMVHQPAVGVLLLALALYWTFYFTARGGPAVIGALLTMGLAIATAVGTVSVDAVLAVAQGVVIGAAAGVAFVWIAHAAIPDSLAAPAATPGTPDKPAAPDPANARWHAFRSLVVVLPVALWFIASSASASYVPVMIKVASMGQQASRDATRVAARSLILSTLIGGAGAVVGWHVLRIAPTLPVYVLFVALAGLMAGPRIFRGAGMRADGDTWSYAYLTMMVILAPAVMDSAGGAVAGAKFVDRMLMFGWATLYAVVAVNVFDAFRPRMARR